MPILGMQRSGPDPVAANPYTPDPLPTDLFVSAASPPAQALADYARINGHPSMPPHWALGCQQSHRTIKLRVRAGAV